jgi:ubiquinone/menaquinone biosynthesis C-methylase UbiE
MLWDEEQVVRRAIGEMSHLQPCRVLEIGCGDGKVTSALAGRARKIVAIDPDEEKIAEARNSIFGVDFRIGSGENLEFKSMFFDLVLFSLSLHHQDSELALREAYRVLSNNGRLIIIEPAVDGDVQQFFNVFSDESHDLKKALDAIETSDFELITTKKLWVNWIFDDKDELYNYDFDRPAGYEYASVIRKMNQLLGNRLQHRPIVLKDKVTIYLMAKKK